MRKYSNVIVGTGLGAVFGALRGANALLDLSQDDAVSTAYALGHFAAPVLLCGALGAAFGHLVARLSQRAAKG